ncbi:AMP-binding protein [Candidatus Woesearchaeota archaeon]|nr:AMP-binding protein [Candidatus Woesearchaeota archaeon]
MIPRIETLPLKKVRRQQDKLLRALVEHAYSHSPFYRKGFKKQGLRPEKIRTVDDLRKMPFTTKEDIRKRNWEFLAVPRRNVVEFVSSSGTTGTPTFIGLTKRDLLRLAINEEKGFICAGATPDDIFQLTVTNDSMFVAGNAFYRGITRLGATALRFGPGNSLRQLMMLKQLDVTGFVSIPSYLVTLGNLAEEKGIDISGLKLKKAILVGESLRNEDFSLNGLGRKITDQWGIELFSTYGNTEMSTSLCECGFHRGSHLHPDLLITEVVDDDGQPVDDYEKGELVVTTLGTEAMPLLRYKTGDITFKIDEKCECGRTATRIGPILARKNHLLKVKGSNVYPGHIENALLDLPEVVNYVIEAHTADNFSDTILLKVGVKRPSRQVEKSIKEKVRSFARMTPDVKLMKPDQVKKIQFSENKRKPKKFFDLRGDS